MFPVKIKTMSAQLFVVTAVLVLLGCTKEVPDPVPPDVVRILALGDSYTKGQGVPREQSFPYQLADSLRVRGWTVPAPHVIAQTGWRTDNLQNAYNSQPAAIRDSTFDLVTLLIGVNNQYQHTSFELYEPQFEQLLQTAIARAGGRADRVVVLSIPDWAYTPFGQNSADPAVTSQEIDAYNAANRALADQYGAAYVNFTGISRLGLDEPGLVATDGLHPSGKQYTLWVEAMLPFIVDALIR